MAGSGNAHLVPDPLLVAQNLTMEFPTKRGTVQAVSGISLDVREGETLGLVGESGCGKSTTGRALIQMPRPTSGSVMFEGEELTSLSDEEVRKRRPKLQMIFQDPISSLNPRRPVRKIISEGLDIWGIGSKAEREAKVDSVLEEVGIDPELAKGRKPHQFSGGQCQRISIARALVMDPKLIICDEPVSALDVSVQAQVLNILEELKQGRNLALVFIAHDLSVVKNVSDRVVVMYLGKICEVGPPDQLYANPKHWYTRALLDAIPVADPTIDVMSKERLGGELPSPLDPPTGCRFRTRCARGMDEPTCATDEPQLQDTGNGQFVACHFPAEVAVDLTTKPQTSSTA
jgi:peptide/nickel transport system ATP-binding protein